MTIDQILFIIIATGAYGLLFFAFGYFVGQRDRHTTIKTITKDEDGITTKEEIQERYINTRQAPVDYPPDGIFSDEPSGPVIRPTASELKKINEDETTREIKEAMAQTIREEGEPYAI